MTYKTIVQTIFLALRTNSNACPIPEEYRIIKASQYLNVAPWELEQNPEWVAWAEAALEAEAMVEECKSPTR